MKSIEMDVSLKSLYELLALVLRSAVGVEYGGDTILCNSFMESLQERIILLLQSRITVRYTIPVGSFI